MPDPDAVKRELSRLARGRPADGPGDRISATPEERTTDGHRECWAFHRSGPSEPADAIPVGSEGSAPSDRDESIVHAAAEAVEQLDRAAAFRRDGGLARLRRAIRRAADESDHETVRRGQRALAAFEWAERAASIDTTSGGGNPTADHAGDRATTTGDPRVSHGRASDLERLDCRKSVSRNPYRGSGRNGNT